MEILQMMIVFKVKIIMDIKYKLKFIFYVY